MKVLVVNYGMGNLGSVRRAFEDCGAEVLVSDDPKAISEVERIVLPGVGAFPDGMANLIAGGWPEKLCEALLNPRLSLLGICLGMQLLADVGDEIVETAGLGLIPGRVTKLAPVNGERIPHIGWNELQITQKSPLLRGVCNLTDFYFVHSYVLTPSNAEFIQATTPYCGSFPSVVSARNVYGTQFHPEKSSRAGFQVIKNFLSR